MEVKINREIREYTESIFFGLSIRQFIFSICACIIAVILYFILRPYFGIETLSWVCILGAVPFAVLGFVRYNGMTAEKFIVAWIKSEILTPKKLTFKPINFYDELCKNKMEDKKSGRRLFKNNRSSNDNSKICKKD
ncbi:MAG: PrgI family protein [Clostridia bacterium]|nr:PrgI family protein [Clostridia bacterium]